MEYSGSDAPNFCTIQPFLLLPEPRASVSAPHRIAVRQPFPPHGDINTNACKETDYGELWDVRLANDSVMEKHNKSSSAHFIKPGIITFERTCVISLNVRLR